jgi:hypothetical protein
VTAQDGPPILHIPPTPTDAELAAIAAALALLSQPDQPGDPTGTHSAPSRWALAGRREAMGMSPTSDRTWRCEPAESAWRAR